MTFRGVLNLTPQSPAATAPANRGALGMAQSSPSLPRPPLLGAVALRSNDGGVRLQLLPTAHHIASSIYIHFLTIAYRNAISNIKIRCARRHTPPGTP